MPFYCATSMGLYLSLLNYGVNRQILIGPYLDSLDIIWGKSLNFDWTVPRFF